MKIGVPVWYGDGRIDDNIEVAKLNGFDYIELSLDYPWPEKLDDYMMKRIRELAQSLAMEIGIHGPWRDICLASPRDVLREASLKIVKTCIEFAYRIEARYFNFHILSAEAIGFDEIRREVMKAAKHSLHCIAQWCMDRGIVPVLENNPTKLLGGVRQIRELIEDLEDIMLCLDVGHAAIAHNMYSRSRQFRDEAALNKWSDFKGRVYVVHLHDYKRKDDNVRDHLLLGVGELDIDECLMLIQDLSPKYLLLEIFWRDEETEASISDLKEVLEVLKARVR